MGYALDTPNTPFIQVVLIQKLSLKGKWPTTTVELTDFRPAC